MKAINKMTKLELMKFMQTLDPIKFFKINWFKGATVVGLRVQVQKIYNSKKQ